MNQLLQNYQRFVERLTDKLSTEIAFFDLGKTEQVFKINMMIDQIGDEFKTYLSPQERQDLAQVFCTHIIWGFGELQQYFDDPQVEEIMINGDRSCFIKYRFKDEYLGLPVIETTVLEGLIERLLRGSGKRVDQSQPVVDLQLEDRSRVHIVLPPVSTQGPIITVRKFTPEVLQLEDLVNLKMLDQKTADFLHKAVNAKANILISGGTATGKTTLLSALIGEITHESERLIIIEESSEIQFPEKLKNVVQLQTRRTTHSGIQEFTIRDLVKQALRMRPDRIIVGESRGGEAFDLLQAMNTGHPGSLTTVHASNADQALERLLGLVMQAGFDQLPVDMIKNWIASSIDLIIQLSRQGNKPRRITQLMISQHNGKFKPLATGLASKWLTHLTQKEG